MINDALCSLSRAPVGLPGQILLGEFGVALTHTVFWTDSWSDAVAVRYGRKIRVLHGASVVAYGDIRSCGKDVDFGGAPQSSLNPPSRIEPQAFATFITKHSEKE